MKKRNNNSSLQQVKLCNLLLAVPFQMANDSLSLTMCVCGCLNYHNKNIDDDVTQFESIIIAWCNFNYDQMDHLMPIFISFHFVLCYFVLYYFNSIHFFSSRFILFLLVSLNCCVCSFSYSFSLYLILTYHTLLPLFVCVQLNNKNQ